MWCCTAVFELCDVVSVSGTLTVMERLGKAQRARKVLQDAAGRAEMGMVADLGWSSNRVRRAYEQASHRVERSAGQLSGMIGEENADRVFASALGVWQRSARIRSLRRAAAGVAVASASSLAGPAVAVVAAVAASVAVLRSLRPVPSDGALSHALSGNLLSALHDSDALKQLPMAAVRRLPASLLVHPVVAADVARALSDLGPEHRRLALSLAAEFHGSILDLCQATSALLSDPSPSCVAAGSADGCPSVS